MLITPLQYAAEMRRIETMRNEAIHLRDRPALVAIHRREADLNTVFWGRRPTRTAG